MTRTFRTMTEVRDAIIPVIQTAARLLGEPVEEDVVARVHPDTGALEFGIYPHSDFAADQAPNIDLQALCRSAVFDCVEAARRRRRARSIGAFHKSSYQPAWSCHAGLLMLAAMRYGGWSPDAIERFAPGRKTPNDITRTVRMDSLLNVGSPNGLVAFDQQSSTDGRATGHARIYTRPRLGEEIRTADLVVLCGDYQTIRIDRMSLPEQAIAAAVGMPVSQVVAHPLTDLVPDMRVVHVEQHATEDSTSLHVRLEDRRMMLKAPPRGADLSFVELGNEMLVTMGFDPVVMLPYHRSMHLA